MYLLVLGITKKIVIVDGTDRVMNRLLMFGRVSHIYGGATTFSIREAFFSFTYIFCCNHPLTEHHHSEYSTIVRI
jgi:hypothetical protein